MSYEYKLLVINENGNRLTQTKLEILQQWFDAGWEYVETIQQHGYEYSPVGVVLKKVKNPLNTDGTDA